MLPNLVIVPLFSRIGQQKMSFFDRSTLQLKCYDFVLFMRFLAVFNLAQPCNRRTRTTPRKSRSNTPGSRIKKPVVIDWPHTNNGTAGYVQDLLLPHSVWAYLKDTDIPVEAEHRNSMVDQSICGSVLCVKQGILGVKHSAAICSAVL